MSQITADLLLITVTAIWGTSFVIVKNAIATMGPLTFLAARFFIGGLVLLVWYLAGLGTNTRKCGSKTRGNTESLPVNSEKGFRTIMAGGLVTGAALLFSYVTQTLGLLTVGAGKAAFITGLYVALVPLASQVLLRSRPDRWAVVGVCLATLGLALLSLELPFHIERGDFLVFLCAVGFTAHILLVGKYSGKIEPVLFTAIQLLVVSLGSMLAATFFERPLTIPSHAWGAILGMALFATSFAFLVQSAVQRYTSPTHTALIFSGEPVFGALFAWLLAGEVPLVREVLGSFFMLAGMLVAELGPAWLRRPKAQRG